MSSRETPPAVGIREVAARLGVSVPTLRRWDRDGKLRATRNPLTGARVYSARRGGGARRRRRDACERDTSDRGTATKRRPPQAVVPPSSDAPRR